MGIWLNSKKHAEVTLTDAQIKALPTTPITLVAAPGSGFRIKVLSVTLRTGTSAGAYTNINTTYAVLEVRCNGGGYACAPLSNDSGYTTPITRVTDFLGAARAAVQDMQVPPIAAYTGVAAGDWQYTMADGMGNHGDWSNLALVIIIDNNGSGNLTGGNAANFMQVIVDYMIQAIP